MTDAGFFRGTSTEQDVRFSDKDKKLLKTMKFEDCLERKVDMHKVNFEALKPWVSEQVTKILGIEDEVVIELIFSFLENDRNPNPKKLQILVTGFLQSKPARIFMGQLWDLLLSAQVNPAKLPEKFIEEKKSAIRQQKKKIEMELTIRHDHKRVSPYRDSYYYRGRSPDPPRSPGRRGDRRNRTELSETEVHVLKSEASSTQADTEHTEGKNTPAAGTQTESKFRSEPDNDPVETSKGTDWEREEKGQYRDRNTSRSRSYSPKRRRHRSHERERRHRYSRPSPHRHHHSPLYSPDSHGPHQRERRHGRESPRRARPHRSPEERHHHERAADHPKHTLQDISPQHTHKSTHWDVQDTATQPTEHHSHATQKQSATEVHTDEGRGHMSEEKHSKRRKVSPPLSTRHQKLTHSRQAKQPHRTRQREESVSSSSRSPSPVEKRHGREDTTRRRAEYSASSSVSSESESSPSPEKHRHASQHTTHSKSRVSTEPVRSRRDAPTRDSSRRTRKHSKQKHHHRGTSESEKSDHTSDNFSEIEARRKEAVRAKKLKLTLSNKRKREKDTLRVIKLKSTSKRVHSEHRGVTGSKRKHSSRRMRTHDDSYDSEHVEEGRDRAKKRHAHLSPVPAKKARHRPPPPPDSITESSDSEYSSSSDSNSEWSGDRRERGQKKRRADSSEDSSESEDSVKRERGHSSLEKHLREKVIQAMSKKRLKKSKT